MLDSGRRSRPREVRLRALTVRAAAVLALAGALTWLSAGPARAHWPHCRPDLVAGFTPGPGASFGHDRMPDIVLGWPGPSAITQQSLEAVSLGSGGSIIFEFVHKVIEDRPGPDFIVFENPFFVSTPPSSCLDDYSVFAEPAFVSVSQDGIIWHPMPYHGSSVVPVPGDSCWRLFPRDPVTPTPRSVIERCAGLAGLTPTYDTPRNPIRPNKPGAWDRQGQAGVSGWGGDAFDLADVGLAWARFVRIQSYETIDSLAMSGADIDAVIAIHAMPAWPGDTIDSDGDMLPDALEVLLGTDPFNPDTDGDGLDDGREAYSCLCPLRYGDTLSGIDVAYFKADSDGDGIPDCYDNCPLHYNPGQEDQDHDFLGDACEVFYGADPANPDTDGGGMLDGLEVKAGLDPANPADDIRPGWDTDGDGLSDYLETNVYFTDPANPDTDGDGLDDYLEVMAFMAAGCPDPLNPDSDGDMLCDGPFAVYDGDTLVCWPGEDMDGDSMVLCGVETDPCNPDTDGDQIIDGLEVLLYGTDPKNPDTDGDGVWDGDEIAAGSNPLDPTITPRVIKAGPDLRVTAQGAFSRDPVVAWTGTEYGLAWEDNRDGNYEIYFARVSGAGAKIGGDLRVTSQGQFSYDPVIAWTGSEYGLAWEDNRDGNYEIYFARVSEAGAKIGGDVRLSANSSYSYDPALVWTGSEFGAAWSDFRDGNFEIYFVRVSAAGVKTGPEIRVTSQAAASSAPALAWAGTQYGLAWQDNRDGNYEIYFQRLSPAGAPAGPDLRLSYAANNSYYPALAWTGSEFGAAWQDNRHSNYEIHFARVSAGGETAGPDRRITRNTLASQSPAVLWTGTEFALAWHDSRDGNDEIYFARVSPGGERAGADLRVTQAPGFSKNPALAWTGSEFGLAWEDNRDGTYEIYFAVFQPDSDGDGLSDYDEIFIYGTDPANWDSDGDRLSDYDEIFIYGTDPNNPDTDGDGLSDYDEVKVFLTDPNNWDTDGDNLPDGFEAANMTNPKGALDPLDPADADLDFDGDGNINRHEYWNRGASLWGPDPVPQVAANVGCYYWGKSDNDGYITVNDVNQARRAFAGLEVDFSQVLPHAYDPMDMNLNGYPDMEDINIIRRMFASAPQPEGYPSTPAELVVVSSPSVPVLEGSTTHVTVSVLAQGGPGLYSSGFGVMFWVDSGNAELLGGEGSYEGGPPGNRYDISMEFDDDASASIVVLITGPGPVVVNAMVPACGEEPLGRWIDEVLLEEAVVINPE